MTRETKSSFARQLGVSPSYVTKLVQEGRLVVAEGQIEVEASLARMNATKDPNRDDVRQRFAKQREEKRKETATPISPVAAGVNKDAGEKTAPRAEIRADEGDAEPVIQAAEVFRKARTAKMHYEARRAVIRVARLHGRLADVAVIRQCAGNDGATLRSMLENLPDQAAPRLAPVRDVGAVAAIWGDLLDDIAATMESLLTKNIAAMREGEAT